MDDLRLGNSGMVFGNESQDIRLGTRWGQQQKHVCYILESTHAYTIVHIFPTLLDFIPASKCGRMAVYESISGHIHILLTNSGQRLSTVWLMLDLVCLSRRSTNTRPRVLT